MYMHMRVCVRVYKRIPFYGIFHFFSIQNSYFFFLALHRNGFNGFPLKNVMMRVSQIREEQQKKERTHTSH